MEMKDDEFQTLRQRVDQISSELDKQNTVRVVNTKWMIIVGAIILSALGFTSVVQLPNEAERAVEKKIGEKIIEKADYLVSKSEEIKKKDFVNLPIGTIIPSMLEWISFADTVGDPYVFDEKVSRWVLADGRQDITKTRYGKLHGNTMQMPDLRGMFLRGMNEERNDDKQDPEENRSAGDYQMDALQQHGHKTTATTLTGYREHAYQRDDKSGIGYTRDPNGKNAPIIPVSMLNVTGAETAVETRPKNVAVYFYIKIN